MFVRHNLRNFILRQAGLMDLCARTRGSASSGVALVDGPVDTTHPVFEDCRIAQIGDSRSNRAGDHATFGASILVACERDRQAGRAMAICPDCTLFNFAFVTDEMLNGAVSIREAAKTLAIAVGLAVQARCRIIVFGTEIRYPEAREWRVLRDALQAALAAGSVAIFPLGNRSLALESAQSHWPEALIAASHNWRGHASEFSPFVGHCGNVLFAPGEHVPGAGPKSGYAVRSGNSYAAAIAAGACALAAYLAPNRPVPAIVLDLCRPPHRDLNGTDFLTTRDKPNALKLENRHASRDARPAHARASRY